MPQQLHLSLYQRLLQLPCCRPVKLTANQIFIAQGEPSDSLYLVQDCAFLVSYLSPVGKRYIVNAQQGFSGILGEMEIFREQGTSVFSVAALSDGIGHQIPRHKLIEAVLNNAELGLAFLQLISHRYEESIGHTLDNILHSLRFNTIRLLIKKSHLSAQGWFEFNIEQHAGELGATPRALRRVIKDLLTAATLEKQHKHYRLLAADSLVQELNLIQK
ncbi:hypothetical protein AYY19_15090 [Photobacterium aquimaris]|uniref:Crp/Fnr family transcriptional regulator n=1 Tax=Photobacterium aquimaris TaxID=512643 RepID=A0A2T3IGA4_9GAMM|nr:MULTISPECIES: Crp/Fnr family transcriptional regulator [Photobacterium]OBU16775.1 hypothetical protein AYY19_15090 [Photobacterium aquimaris]OBU18970.1 hypothetical protein AYY20_18150 [Photobacterium aquimaris]PSU25817.1 Crp/Fnr family transcriptional regulator [Photobacterium aquimaris]PSV97964.1 Crp/Fnr family transcriptional regulator [Photobacterium aquimaris]